MLFTMGFGKPTVNYLRQAAQEKPTTLSRKHAEQTRDLIPMHPHQLSVSSRIKGLRFAFDRSVTASRCFLLVISTGDFYCIHQVGLYLLFSEGLKCKLAVGGTSSCVFLFLFFLFLCCRQSARVPSHFSMTPPHRRIIYAIYVVVRRGIYIRDIGLCQYFGLRFTDKGF